MRSNIIVNVLGEHTGFLLSIARLLSRDHNVTIVSMGKILKIIQRNVPELKNNFVDLSSHISNINTETIVQECQAREEKYGEFFSMISSHDRGLGKGYIFNADRHPDIGRSWWAFEDKLKKMLSEFIFYEQLIDKYAPDVIITGNIGKIAGIVSRHNNISIFSVTSAKFGNRWVWVENEYLHNTHLLKALKTNIETGSAINQFPVTKYLQIASSKKFHSQLDFSYLGAFKALAGLVFREFHRLAREIASRFYRRKWKTSRRSGYRLLGWAGPILRRPFSYGYLMKHGVEPSDLNDRKIVYFPLHLEPEVALLSVSPEFNNSMEAIAWISKSLPVDTILVVKEQPVSLGIRSKHYYDNLRRIGNVHLAKPTTHPWDWIKASVFTATITGTAGIESLYLGKPCLSLGKHQLINELPTVRYANNFESVKQSIQELLAFDPNDKIFGLCQFAMHKAQIETSFGYDPDQFSESATEERDKFTELKPQFAKQAVDNLYRLYPGLFLRA